MGCVLFAPRAPLSAEAGGGVIRADEGTAEVLPPHSGHLIRTPEGFLRVESGELDASSYGSFGTYRARVEVEPGVPEPYRGEAPPPHAARAAPAGALGPGGHGDPCREHRERYLRRLMRLAGVDVDRPLDLAEALTGPAGYRLDAVTAGMLAGADPLRSLAWDSELRSIAGELSRCASAAAPAR